MSYPTAPPISQTPRPWAFPPVVRATLPWGAEIAVVRSGALPLAQVRWSFRGGRSQEPSDRPGVARLLCAVARHGTARYSSASYADALDQLGARARMSTSLDLSQSSLVGQARHVDRLLDLLDEVTFRPTFPSEDLERERASALEVHEHDRLQPEHVGATWMSWLLHPDHPYGRPGATAAGLRAATREDLVALHATLFDPARAQLLVVGDVDPDRLLPALLDRLSSPPRPPGLPCPAPGTPAPGPRTHWAVRRPDAEQVAITAGLPSLSRGHPDFHALKIATQIFGGGSLGRLFGELRERQGLTYGASCALDAGLWGGDLIASLSTAPEKAPRAVAGLLAEFDRLHSAPITADELANAQGYLIGTFPQKASGVAGLGGLVARAWLLGLPEDTWATYPVRVAALSLDAVRDAAARWIRPDAIRLVAVGGASDVAAALQGHDPVQTGDAERPPYETGLGS